MPKKDPNKKERSNVKEGEKNNSNEKDPQNKKAGAADNENEQENEKKDLLEMNLAEGEIVHYFSWKRASFALLGSIILAVIVLVAVSQGISWWGDEKSKQNEFFSQKSDKLEVQTQNIKKESEHLFVFKKKLDLVNSELLANHIYWSNFFDYLENNTLEQVSYNGFSGDISGVYTLPVIADDYNVINTQVQQMKEKEVTKNAEVKAASKGKVEEGGDEKSANVDFSLNLEVSRQLFIK
jgi:hypothetical protein